MATDDTFGLPPLPAGFEPVDPGMPSIAQVPTPVDVAAPKAERVEAFASPKGPAVSGDIKGLLDAISKEHGVDRNLLGAFAEIESGYNPRAKTGSYKGLFQLSDDEFAKHGGQGDIYDPQANATAAALKLKAESDDFSRRYGRAPSASELYLIHQQGIGGADAHWRNPDAPAWLSMYSTAEGKQKGERWAKQAIWGNLPPSERRRFGDVNNVTSRDFTEFWNGRVARAGGSGADSLEGGTGADSLPPLPAGFTLIDEPAAKSDLPPLPKGFSPVDDKAADKKSATFMESVGRGVDQMQGMLYGGVEALGELTGSKGMTGFGREGRVRNDAEAKAYGDAAEFTKIRTAGDFGQWVKETVGSQIPVMAPMLAGGAAGAAIGSVVPVVGTTLGGIIGAFAPGFVMSTGETQGNIKEKDPNAVAPGSAFVGGAAIAALDSVLPGRVGSALVRKFGAKAAEEIAEAALKKEVKDGFIKRNAKGVAVGMATEGLTESLQEAIGDVAAAYGTGKPLDPNLGTKMIEAGAAGALLGGIMGPMHGGGSPKAPEGEEPGQKKVLALPPPPASQAVVETPPTSSPEVATLKAMGYSDQAIAEMTPEERAAEVADAPSMGAKAADVPSAEPVKDLTAQIGELAAGNRDGVYLSPDNVANVQSNPEFIKAIAEALGQTKGADLVDNVDGKGGILIAKDKATGEAAKAAIASGTDPQAVLGAATGAGAGKAANADTAVQQRTPDGAVTRESAVPAADAPAVAKDMAAPGKTVETMPLADAVARREQGVAAEKSAPEQVVGNSGEFPTSFRPAAAPDGDGSRSKPVKVEIPEDVAVAGQRVAEPTEAQKEANNYRHGHLKIHGLDISIETPKGAIRRGKGWKNVSPAAYGYFKGVPARARDKEHVDVYVGDDVASERAFVVDQYDPDTGRHDEPKVVLGVNSAAEATALYDAGFSDKSGPQRRGAVTEMTVAELKGWLETGDATKPVGEPKSKAPAAAEVAEAPETGPSDFDVSGWLAAREERIKESKAAGNKHLDQLPRAVEGMRGVEFYNVHDPKERGVVRTVSNRGDVVVNWADKYSADKNLVDEKTKDGKSDVWQSWLAPTDLKDYVAKAASAVSDSGPAVEPLSADEIESVVKAWRYVKAVDDALKAGKSVQQARIDEANELDADLYSYGITLEEFPDESSLREYLRGGGEGVVESTEGRAQGEAAEDRPGQGQAGAHRSEAATEPARKDQAGEASRDEVGKGGQTSLVPEATTSEKIAAESKAKETKGKSSSDDAGPLFNPDAGKQADLVDLAKKPVAEFDPAQHIKLVADDISKVRASDVERLFQEAPRTKEAWTDLRVYIAENRPDLIAGALDVIGDLGGLPKSADEVARAGEMAKNREERAALNRRLVGFIQDYLRNGGTVRSTTVYRIISLTKPEHIRVAKDGTVQIPEGSKWVSLFDSGVDDLARQAGWDEGKQPDKPVATKPETSAVPEETVAAEADKKADSDPLVVVLRGAGFKTIVEARKFVREAGIVPADATNKQIDEKIETAVVAAAREIIAEGKSPAATFKALTELYANQPNLASRTGTSVANQAYSTPAPLAYVASRLAGVQAAAEVYEPSAGNGMLLIEADPAKVAANEIDPDRAKALEAQGFTVTQNDGAEVPSLTDIDSVIMNPPFGAVKEGGKSKVFEIGGWQTTQIDHAIALNGLAAMADDGKAVLILGGTKSEKIDERRKDYRGKAKREFYYRLYNQYNVTDHFTASGDLYTKQGASWPVDVIVIEGRGKSSRELPAANPPAILKTWAEIGAKLDGRPDTQEAGQAERPARDAAARGERPASGNAGPRQEAQGGRSQSVRAEAEGDPGAVRAERDRGEPADVRSGRQPAAAESVGDRDGGRADRAPAAEPLRPRVKRERQEGASQAPYEPVSNAKGLDTLIPVNMADAARRAMEKVEQKHGTVDQFVADRLGYDAKDLGQYFSAEQVDAIASAIDNIEKGSAQIVGDQTGVGKGRIAAGVLRYAMKQGMVPVFITEKPDLYGDIYRDLRDIGVPEMLGREPRMFITNAGETITLDEEALAWKQEVDEARANGEPLPKRRGKFLTGGTAQKVANSMARIQAGEDVADIVLTTYDQMNTVAGKTTARRQFLTAVAPRAMVVMDEAHNAGGAAKTGWQSKNAPETRADFARVLAKNAKGVMFSSATYAKRPDVMDLYARTDMGKAVEDSKDLPELIQRGGVPMQQIVASMLAESGQYLRRERSFDGVEYALTPVEVDQRAYKQFSAAMQSIFRFDLEVEEFKKEWGKDQLDQRGWAKSKDSGVGSGSASSISFSALMHNITNQMLLAIKAEATAKEAIAAAKRGEKPVVALANTNESFIKDFAEQEGIAIGQALDLDFGAVLERYLSRTLRITLKGPDGEKQHIQIPVADLPASLRQGYQEAMNAVREGNYESLPISPIDWIRYRLGEAGLSVREVTGRQTMIDYKQASPKYIARPKTEQGASGKRGSIAAFNAGKLDALILNRSGSTGVSMHASKTFKDQRRRRMILAQAEGNIDTHLQMLGRVHRTGQVITPAYSQIAADIPAEARPTAVLMKKMASLNANTTGARGSAFTVDSADFMNEVGDKVVAELLQEDPDLNDKLGEPLTFDENNKPKVEDVARKATGRLVLLDVAVQEQFLNAVQKAYKAEIDQLDALGENPLEAKTVDIQAKTLESSELKPRTGDSPFTDAVRIEKVSAKAQGRAMPPSEVVGKVADALKVERPAGDDAAALVSMEARGRAWRDGEVGRVADLARRQLADELASTKPDSRDSVRARGEAQVSRWRSTMGLVYPGARVKIGMPAGDLEGVVLSVERTGKAKQIAALGAWAVKIAVPDSMRQLEFPMSKLFPDGVVKGDDEKGATITRSGRNHADLAAAFDDARKEGRETRYIVTGNILGGYDQTRGRGRIVNFTTDDGQIKPGILMGREFDLGKFMDSRRVRFPSGATVAEFLSRVSDVEVSATDGDIVVSGYRGAYRIEMAAARQKAGKYFTDADVRRALGGRDFERRGTKMIVEGLSRDEVARAIDEMKKIGAAFETNVAQDEAQKIIGAADEQPLSALAPTAPSALEGLPVLPGGIVGFGGSAPLFAIRAFHGSPHDFDRFDVSRIGTGEGAQAFGHGLYFAENEGVAQQYKKALGDRKQVRFDGVPPSENASVILHQNGYDVEASIARLRGVLDDAQKFGDKRMADIVSRDLAEIEGLRGKKADLPGRMYEVRINAEPDQFLDWDKPLSEQPKAAQDVLAQYADAPEKPYEGRAASSVNAIRNALRQVNMRRDKWQDALKKKDVADQLREAGVPGIKYLDQKSRIAGEGSRNYVVFDDGLIEIVAKDGQPISPAEREQVMSALVPKRGRADSLIGAVEDAVLSGEAYTVQPSRVASQIEAIRPALKIVPSDSIVGVLERITPETDSAIDPLNWTMKAEFRLPDGATFELVGVPRSWLLDNRAFALPPALARKFAGGRPTVLFNNLGAAENLGSTARGEAWHEGLHILWGHFFLSADARSALLRHARSLRVLDMPARDFFALIGDPDFERVADGVTLRDLYTKAYKGRRDLADIMRQEEVSHMLELYSHGTFSDDEMAPVQSILDDIERGAVSGNEGRVEAVGEDVLAALDSSVGQSMRRELDALGYYSKALEAARGLKQAKGTPEQMLAQLKAAGVKDAEIEATNLRAALDGKKAVTRDEIVKHLEQNRTEIKERQYQDKYADLGTGSLAIIDKVTKWSRHSLDPSNPTYRETVLHLPNDRASDLRSQYAAAKSEPERQRIMAELAAHEDTVFASGHFPEPNIVGHMMTSMTTHEGRPVFTIDQIQSDWGQELRDTGDPNKAEGLREQLRSIGVGEYAANIARTYSSRDDALAYLQSAEKYSPTPENKEAIAELSPLLDSTFSEVQRIGAELSQIGDGKPALSHPLVNTTDQWLNTTLRRAIRQAAEANADYIAIPTGKTVESYNPQGDSEGNAVFYEKIVPKNLRNLLQKIDKATPAPSRIKTLDSPSGKTGLGQGFTLFPLSNVVKWAVKAEGQPGKSETAARDVENSINDAVEIVSRIAGPGVDVRMAERIPRWQFDVERPEGSPRDPGGVYQRPVGDARALITLAYADPSYDVRTTAGHEAYHHVETVLATPQEMKLLRSPSEMERATRHAAAETGRSIEETRKLPDYEIRAIAFQRYRRMREEGMSMSPIHIGVRRVWDAMLRLARGVRNVLRGQGFDSMEGVFERARTGEMAARGAEPSNGASVAAPTPARTPSASAVIQRIARQAANEDTASASGQHAAAFAEQWLKPADGASVSTVDMYEAYLTWAEAAGAEALTMPSLVRAMGDTGLVRQRIAGRDRYIGVAIKAVGERPQAALPGALDPVASQNAEEVAAEVAKGNSIWEAFRLVGMRLMQMLGLKPEARTETEARILHLERMREAIANDNSATAAIHGNVVSLPGTMASFFPTATSSGTYFGRKTAAIMRRIAPLSDAWRVRLQDKALPIRRRQEAIQSSTGVELPLPLDVYVSEALYHGRAGEKATDLQQKHIEPLVEHLRKSGIDADELGDFLYARHAAERNAYIRTIDPSNDAGSGMTDAEAQQVLAKVASGPKAQAYAEAARMAEAINKQTRDLLLASGLISRETYDAWSSQYQSYVPLRGFEVSGDEEQTFPRVGRGFDIRGPEARQALGRRTKSDNPLAYIILQAQQAIVRAEKNRVNKTLMRLVEQHPDPDVWQVYRGEYRRKLNEATGQVETVFVPPQFSAHDPSIVGVKIGGKQHYIKLEDRGLARAMRGIGSSEFDHAIVRNMMALTRTYAQMLTSWNPEFVVGNFFRDAQTALLNSKDIQDLPEGTRRKMIAEALSLKSIRGIYNALRGDGSAEYATWFEEFRQAGGKISFMDYSDVERIKKRVDGMLKTGKMADVGRALRQAGKFVEDANTAVENGVRLSTYVAMRKAGIPQDRAAFVARELTVNFNRRGEWGPIINSAYMFFNASVQGSVRMMKALGSPAVQRAVLAIIAGAVGIEMYNYLAAGDDDDGENAYEKIKPWIKERNMIFMLPGRKDYIMIPMPYGYNVFYTTGRVIGELGRTAAGRGKLTPAKAASHIGGAIASSFNPLGEAGSLSQTFTPTLLDPILQVSENKTWYGGPIYPTKFDKKKPDSENYFSSVHPAFISVAKWLNSASGGNPARSGYVDISPEVLEHYAQFAGGGIAKFVLNAHGTGQRMLNNEEWIPEKTPILRRLYGAQTSASRRSDFFEKWNEVDAAHYEVTQLAKAGDQSGAAAARAKYGPELQAYNAMKGVQKKLSEFSKERARVQLSKSLSDSEKETKVKEIKERENAIILRVLEVYTRAQKSRQP